MSEQKTIEVYKADIPLQEGETIQMYLEKLRGASQKKFGTPRTDDKPGIYAYTRAVFSDRLVMEKDVEGPGRGMKLWSVEYSRADNGDFKFGTPSEVKEKIDFVPVSKAQDQEQPERVVIDNIWKGLPR